MNFRSDLYTTILVFVFFSFSTANAQTLTDELAAVADITVDINGGGDYTTVQAALSAIPDSNDQWKVVFVKTGTYYEKVVLNHKKTKVVLVGEDVDSTIITYDDHADAVLPGHTFSSYTFRADAHDFQAYNITFQNPATQSQAVAFHSNGDRQILYHCKMLGFQDTYFDNFRTRRYIKDCYIAGAVDYIFGFGVTLFDSCQIHTTTGGYVTAAATPQYYEFGYVFKNCFLTKDQSKNYAYFLGRPWFDYSNTIFYECWMDKGVQPRGWETWSGREQTCVYREYNNYGPGARQDFRVSWSSQLDSTLADRYNIDTIFAVSNFPIDSGAVVDSVELWSMRDRFEASGYADRADTILYAGRDHYPEYPTENWSPQYYDSVYSIIRKYVPTFADSIDSWNVGIDQLPENKYGVKILSPFNENLIISSEKYISSHASMKLYDLSGRQVFEHVFDFISQGQSIIPFESSAIGKGIYIYSVETADSRATGKILKY